jgi:hypothetical protein
MSQSSESSGLNLRRHQRHAIDLRAAAAVYADHAKLVRFAADSGAADGVEATLADLGEGGLGLLSREYLPKKCALRVMIDTSSLGPEHAELGFEVDVRVMRITMIGAEPEYLIGCAFLRPTDELRSSVKAVLDACAERNAREREEEAA